MRRKEPLLNQFKSLAISIASASLLVSCQSHETVEQLAPVVNVQTVSTYSPSGASHYSAVIKPNTEVPVAFNTGGYVANIVKVNGHILQAGDTVRKGAVLASVRTTDSGVRVAEQKATVNEIAGAKTRAQASLAEAQSALVQSRLDFERIERLFKEESATKPDFEAAKSRMEINQARVLEAQAQIDSNDASGQRAQAALHGAQINLADCYLKAPIDGVIIRRNIEQGALVAVGSVGFVMADMSSVKVAFGVPDVELRDLKIGQAVNINTEALPDRTFAGRISDISPEADSTSRVFNVEVTLPNYNRLLKSGMVASLSTHLNQPSKPQPAIPLNAIVRSSSNPNGYAVYIVTQKTGKTTAEERQVQLGDAFGQMITVLNGLSLGDQVITNGSTRIANGQEIRIAN